MKLDGYYLLAEGKSFVMVGSPDGQLYRMRASPPLLNTLRKTLLLPQRHTCPPQDSPVFQGLKTWVDDTVPDGIILVFRHIRDRVSGLHIYAAFEPGRGLWHLRELRGEDGTGTGLYVEEL